MLLAVPQPYDFHLSTVRFRDFGTDGATVWHDDGLHRVVAGREIRIEPMSAASASIPRAPRRRPRSRASSGCRSSLTLFTSGQLGIPCWSRSWSCSAVSADVEPAPFEALVVAITTQQISLRAAAAIRGRFVQRYGVRHDVAWEFPAREIVARADPGDFPTLGFSRKKAEYVIGLARSDLDFEALATHPDEDVIATLTAVPGLGRWTADWFLARHLARPQAWPAGDLGVRKAVSTFYADGRPLSIPEVRAMGDRFAPFQNLSAQFLLAGARMAG